MANYTSWLRHGTVCPTPPVSFTDVHAYVFGVDASREAIQDLADELLAPTAGAAVKYDCPASAALVTFTNADRGASLVDQIGWLPGREMAIWVLLIERRSEPFSIRPVLWAPYIFIDTDIGMVPGREVWGWPKAIGHVAVATDQPSSPAHFGVTTTVFRTFNPDLPGQPGVGLVSVDGTQPLQLGAPTWVAGAEVVSALADEFLPEVVVDLLRFLPVDPLLPAIALKQFRDSIDPTSVCFRALVNAPCRFTGFQAGHLLTDTFTLTIETCESHAICKDLFGTEPTTASTTIPVRWAAALNFDFVAENGSIIV